MTTQIRDLFKIPAEIRPMDFTVVLAEGATRPEETIATYRVTDGLKLAFARALELVGGALRDGRSQAAYLHGSFGTGKSHFMAMLGLLLADDPRAWATREFSELRPAHPWVITSKLLQLRLHMLDQQSFEGAIFGAYLHHVRTHHPDAPLPLLFADAGLFADADAMRERLGDDAFFATLAPPEVAGRWGKLAASTWTRARFDAARGSTDANERGELLAALVRTPFFRSRLDSAQRLHVDFDTGLQELTRHAGTLGYTGVVLFLDELILWLSMNAGTPELISTWVGRMVKLVQGDHARRAIPIVSFIARQRELRDLIGADNVGPEQARIDHVLDLARGRFGEVRLEDDNLPAIIEKRVLIPRSDGAVARIDQTFADLERSINSTGKAWNTLLGTDHDRKAFRRVYPFSPVLVDALIRLSQLLQRQRTALRVLVEMLHDHMDDVELGDLVGVGDLFDPLVFGAAPDDPAQAARFRSARQIYADDLLPQIQTLHATRTPEQCQRLRDGARQDIGCSNCIKKACRSDNRVVKTLLLSALIPGLPAFHDLTVRRLLDLNPGRFRSIVPGLEVQDLTQRLRTLGQATGHIQVGRESDPGVSIVLDQVDVQSIVRRAREKVRPGLCQTTLGALLYEALELPGEYRPVVDHKVWWRQTRRTGEIVFGNVRRMDPEQLRCPEGHDFRLVIDHPFDEGTYGPLHDITALEEFAAHDASTWTLVWLPSFFSESSYRTLEELVAIGVVLDDTASYVQHLSVEKQVAARTLLENLQREKRSLLLDVLEKAYGLHPAKDGDPTLDPSRRVAEPLRLLVAGERLAPSMFAGNLKGALASYVPALLATRYPHHPELRVRLSNKSAIETVLRTFDNLCDQPDHRLADLKREELETLRGILGALGVVRLSESAVHLVTDGPLQRIERRREQDAIDSPTVAELAAWHDEGFRHGLQPEALAVLVRCYVRLYARTLSVGGRPWTLPANGLIPDHVVLEKPELPRDEHWGRALKLTGAVFGLSTRSSNTADNLRAFSTALDERLRELRPAADSLPTLLGGWLAALGLPDDGPRLLAAQAARDLLRSLPDHRALTQVEVLAAHSSPIGPRALASSLASARAVVEQLGSALLRGSFEQLRLRPDPSPETTALLDELAELLTAGEHDRPLVEPLRRLGERATALNLEILRPPRNPPTEPSSPQPARDPLPTAEPPRPRTPDIRISDTGIREPRAPLHKSTDQGDRHAPRQFDRITSSSGDLEAMLAELRTIGQATTGPLRWQVKVEQRAR